MISGPASLRDGNRYASAGVLGILFVSLSTLYLIRAPSMHHLPVHRSIGALHMPVSHFRATYLAASSDPSQDSTSLGYLCHQHPQTRHNFSSDLILYLDDANGGIGNIRANVLDFVFLAIATGSSIVLPSFARRDETDLSSLFAGRTPFTTFFDKGHFVRSIRAACPDLHVYDEDSVAGYHFHSNRYAPASMRSDLDPAKSIASGASEFQTWLSAEGVVMPLQSPIVIRIGRTLWDGPDTFSLPARVRRDFGALLRHPEVVRGLAANATFVLARRFGLDLRPSGLYYRRGAYMGAHLRTEQDAAKAGWLSAESAHANFSGQTDAYLSQAREEGARVIYAASGSQKDLEGFAEKAWRTSRVNVTTKHELLDSDDMKVLGSLSWDQQALVDYEILKRSRVLGGFVMSSFSYNLAVARAAVLEMEGRVVPKGWRNVEPRLLDRDDTTAFRDPLSVIWGRNDWHEKKIPRGAWP